MYYLFIIFLFYSIAIFAQYQIYLFNKFPQQLQQPYIISLVISSVYSSVMFIWKYMKTPVSIKNQWRRMIIMLLVLGVIPSVIQFSSMFFEFKVEQVLERLKNTPKYPMELFWKCGMILRIVWVWAAIKWTDQKVMLII